MTNKTHIALIHDLFAEAEEKNLPLWLESGWAIDARLHKISREHEDIDLAFPIDRQSQFIAILRKFGSRNLEKTDYGFLVHVREVLLDCEPCYQHGDNYELKDMPMGSCPWKKQGMIEAVELRCTIDIHKNRLTWVNDLATQKANTNTDGRTPRRRKKTAGRWRNESS